MNEPRKPRSPLPTHSTASVWEEFSPRPRPPLTADASVDLCVIGAGFAGLAAAYRAASEGLKVAVLDAGGIANGESSATTAHLTAALDDRWFELEELHGLEACRAAAGAHSWAIDWIEKTARERGIDCGFRRVDGWLFGGGEEAEQLLAKELAAASRCGLRVESAPRAPIPGHDTGPAVRFLDQAQLHPLRWLEGLASAAEGLGARIHGGTEALEIEDGEPARVVTRDGRTVTARAVIVATNVPVNDRVALQTRLYPYRTYVIAGKLAGPLPPPALLWDNDDPYHYVRMSGDALIVGGADHKVGQADDAVERYAGLERWARERFPTLGPVAWRWSGQIIETPDGLGFAGRNPGQKHVYTITGGQGNGTTHGTLGGALCVDLIRGRESAWAEVFAPSRAPRRGAREWVKENLNAAAQYKDYATKGDVRSEDEIAPGSGAVLRRGLLKVAAYKDDAGEVHELSAICPHLGGVVCWNHAEKSWDCPVHGSRFTPTGEVLNGPAQSGLRPVPEKGPERRPKGRTPRA